MQAIVRKFLTVVETTRREMGQDLAAPTRKAAAIAVIENPFAGRDAQELEPLIEIGEELGGVLGEMAVAALCLEPAAILHPKLGKPLRAAVERGTALVPSSKKTGGIGTAIDVPLGHKDAAYVRSHFDAMEVRVPDAPRAGEIVVAVVVTDAGRPRPRVGGLAKHQIEGKDGLR